jgi:TPR repeat protein
LDEDVQAAVESFRKAAELGSEAAMVNLGHCYYWGNGVEKNLDEAKSWYSKAADLGNVYGMFYLGNTHCEAAGAEMVSDLSSSWLRDPKDQELLMGVANCVTVITKGPPEEVEAEAEVPPLELPEEASGY